MRTVTMLVFIVTLFGRTAFGQAITDSMLSQLLSKNSNPVFQQVLNDPSTYRLQIIYTRIDRKKNNEPVFQNYYFNYAADLYFNPASTVKLPLALLSLEKLNELDIRGVNKYTTLVFDSSYERQVSLNKDSSAESRKPSIAQFIRKALLVSDNDAYNRMYQFVGQQRINRALHDKGYQGLRITRQFMGLTAEQNRHTNQIQFLKQDGAQLYVQPAAYNPDSFHFPAPIKIGRGHLDRNDSLVNEPIDFTFANYLSLLDLQRMLQTVLFPSSVPKNSRFNLSKDDYRFMYRYLSQFPSETNFPKYDTSKYYDSYVKFFFRNETKKLPGAVRVFNKVGWAYGFLTDVSYVIDPANKIEFMLAATVYVNSDGILNDDKYDYDSIGHPFLYQLGQTIYNYELRRDRSHRPNLKNFQIKYDHRDPADRRPSIREVDN